MRRIGFKGIVAILGVVGVLALGTLNKNYKTEEIKNELNKYRAIHSSFPLRDPSAQEVIKNYVDNKCEELKQAYFDLYR